ncbi:MAG: DUF3592 domain-containing protein [Planctomycetota bacterium]
MTHVWLYLFYVLPFIGVGSIVLGLKNWKHYEKKLLQWQRIDGHVVDVIAHLGGVECPGTITLKYMYDVGGKAYVGFYANCTSLEFKVGDSIQILSDPDNPFDSVPTDALKNGAKLLFVFGAVFISAGAFIFAVRHLT